MVDLLALVDDRTMLQFWTKIRPEGECWEWTGAKNGCGYSQFKVKGHRISGHRFAFMMAYGPMEAGTECCHTCHSRSCVNPRHMYAGSRKENVRDTIKAGTHNFLAEGRSRGTRNGNARLTDEAVTEIRRRRSEGQPAKALASEYGVSTEHIYSVARGRSWRPPN